LRSLLVIMFLKVYFQEAYCRYCQLHMSLSVIAI
jgi:hypothetical protein